MLLHKRLTLVPGDVVMVEATVSIESPGGSAGVPLTVSGGLEVYASRNGLSAVSFAIAQGDEVRAIEALDFFQDEKCWPYGIVIAVSGESSWVRWPLGDSVEPTKHLQRIRTAREVEAFAPRPHEEVMSPEEISHAGA